jgi:Ca2+-binding RTX toxin-like protein
MTNSLSRVWALSAIRSALVTVALLSLLLADRPARAAMRNDIVLTLDASTAFIFLEVDGFGADMGLVRGTVSIETDDATCVASVDHPCSYVVNYIRIEYSSFTQPTTAGDVVSEEPFVVVQGPIPVVDSGFGIVIATDQPAEGGSTIIAPDPVAPGFRRGTNGITQPLTMNLDVPNQGFSLEGEFSSTFQGSTGNGTIISSGNSPFTNLPPTANAGADVASTCGQTLTLDASASTDAIGGPLDLFRWSTGGVPLVTISAGTDNSVTIPNSLGIGSHEILLEAYDRFGSVSRDIKLVTVANPAPQFEFVPAGIVTSTCGAVELGLARAKIQCGATVTVTNNAPASFPVGVTNVVWTATASNGLTATAVQRVEVLLGDNPACCPAGYNVIVGTSNNNTLNGTAGNDCILGLGAQDTINGNGGNDLISGGPGNDVINGGNGNDVINGGTGQDQVNGDAGNDALQGGDGDDVVSGGTGQDTLRGGQGQDTLRGNDDDDLLLGESGDDTLEGANGNDRLVGGPGGADSCNGGAGSNLFTLCESTPGTPGAPNSCSNSALDPGETAVDCGGYCGGCATGAACVTGSDCLTNACSNAGVCQALSNGSLVASFTVNADWGGGYCVALNVANPTPMLVTNWTASINTNQSTIYDSWNATFSGSSGNVTIAPSLASNKTIEVGETDSSIGFCANRASSTSGKLPQILNAAGM